MGTTKIKKIINKKYSQKCKKKYPIRIRIIHSFHSTHKMVHNGKMKTTNRNLHLASDILLDYYDLFSSRTHTVWNMVGSDEWHSTLALQRQLQVDDPHYHRVDCHPPPGCVGASRRGEEGLWCITTNYNYVCI